MNEKLLKLVGEIIKEGLDHVKSEFTQQLQDATKAHKAEIEALSKAHDDKLQEMKDHYADQTKKLHQMVLDIELKEGIPGQDGKSVELDEVIRTLKSDDEFMIQVKGEQGEAVILDDVIDYLKGDAEFLDSVKGVPGEKGEPGDKGLQGEKGEPGVFNKAIEYDGSIVKKYDFVVHKGALWQNLMDDNNTPPSRDNHSYQCVVEKPKDAKSIVPKGLYKEDAVYTENDVVMFNNASWIKNGKDSQELPGEGWFLLAKGTKGSKGERGEKGDPGQATDVTKALEERVHKLEAKGIIHESTGK